MANFLPADRGENEAHAQVKQAGAHKDRNGVKNAIAALRGIQGGRFLRAHSGEAAQVVVEVVERHAHQTHEVVRQLGSAPKVVHPKMLRFTGGKLQLVHVGQSHQGPPEELVDGQDERNHRENSPEKRVKVASRGGCGDIRT